MTKTPSLETCAECGARCCRHVAMSIDKPVCKRDYDNIRWFLMHKGVSVFVDHDGDWVVQFLADCRYLGTSHECTRYEERPRVCRDYPAPDDECEHLGEDEPHRILFTTAEQFEQYLAKKGKEWRWQSTPRGPLPRAHISDGRA
jgi:uncharacterized protein